MSAETVKNAHRNTEVRSNDCRTVRKASASDTDEKLGDGNRQKEKQQTIGKGRADERNGRRGSNSVGRKVHWSRHDFEDSGKHKGAMGGGMALKRMDSEERNRNEKLLSCPDSVTRICDRSTFYKMFELVSQIGQGNFSDVFLVFNTEKCEKYAVKEIDKGRMRGKWHFVDNEIALLLRCRHRNICRLVDAFESRRAYFLLFDYAPKGDLLETIRRIGRLSERSCAQITRQISSALAFLHRRRIVHRDVKPENILVGSDSIAKLTDFGLACFLLGPLYRVCGTPTYVAPEILTQKGYGVAVDIWSLGIILHICLVGFAPFHSTERAQLFQQIVQGQFTFDHPNWSPIGTKAKKLLLGMLTTATKRMDAEEVTRDEWIMAMVAHSAGSNDWDGHNG